MPKVLRIINRFNLGGPTYNAAYLSRYMAPEYETLLIGGAREESEENSEYIVRNLGLDPIIIPEMRRSINPLYDIKALKKIKQIIKDFKPDIVHTHASKSGALGRKAAYELKVPVIIHTFHGHVFDAYFSNFKAGFYKRIERKLAEKSSCIIALSENQKNDLAHKFKICGEDKIVIIPLGFDLSRFQEDMTFKRARFREEYCIDDDETAIGIIGRVVPIKNHSLFLRAISNLANNTNKKIRAFIVGDGEERHKMENMAQSLGLTWTSDPTRACDKDQVMFTSWIKDIDCVNAGMDIIASTSLNEGTPVSLIEAQASNKPIVSTKVGGIENIVLPGKTALLSDVTDEDLFTKHLISLVNDIDYRSQFALHGWEHVKQKFHYTRLVSDMSALYKTLLEKNSR
jgi:glycosyltransferase involved in cell wall biosynthesis